MSKRQILNKMLKEPHQPMNFWKKYPTNKEKFQKPIVSIMKKAKSITKFRHENIFLNIVRQRKTRREKIVNIQIGIKLILVMFHIPNQGKEHHISVNLKIPTNRIYLMFQNVFK